MQELEETYGKRFSKYLIKRIISAAADRNNLEKELSAQLLAKLYGSVLSSEDVKQVCNLLYCLTCSHSEA